MTGMVWREFFDTYITIGADFGMLGADTLMRERPAQLNTFMTDLGVLVAFDLWVKAHGA